MNAEPAGDGVKPPILTWDVTGGERATMAGTDGLAAVWLVVTPDSAGHFSYAVERIADGELRHGERVSRAAAKAAALMVGRLLLGTH